MLIRTLWLKWQRQPAQLGERRIAEHPQGAIGRLVGRGGQVARLPVDDLGLGWQVGDEQPLPANPDRDARLARLADALEAARVEGRPMRSAWWILPFAACLSAEWWLRRRRGLR